MKFFWNRRQRDAELDDEIQSHLALAAREREATAEPADEAGFAARREFGNVTQVKEVTREMWGWTRAERLMRDLKLTLRGFRRTPTFAVTAVLILGLGIGMASATFSVFQQVLVKRFPMREQERLIEMSGVAQGTAKELPIGIDQVKDFGRQSKTVEAVAAYAHWGAAPGAVVDGDRMLNLRHAAVTGNFFQVLGAGPFLGRLFEPNDERDYTPVTGQHSNRPEDLVAVLSYDTWRRQFGGDPHVVGRRVRTPRLQWTPLIVGVALPGLDFPRGVQIWTPNAYANGDLVARLLPGASIGMARADLAAFIKNDPTFLKEGMGHVDARAEPLEQMIVGDVRPALVIMTAAVGLLLLLACVNIANLLLLRVAGRSREVAVCRALGASNRDIVRQLTMESVVLAAAGGVLGLFLSKLLLGLLIHLAPAGLPRLDMVRFAPTPVMVTAGLALFAAVLFGLLLGLGSSRIDFARQLRADTRSGTEGKRLRGVRQLLVASQIALALVLLAGAGLLMRSFARLSGLDMGYATTHLSFAGLALPWDQFVAQCGSTVSLSDTVAATRLGACMDTKGSDLHDRLTEAFQALPGVRAVSSVAGRPFLGFSVLSTKLTVEGQTEAEAARNPWVNFEAAGPGYFDALGLQLLRGRFFTAADREESPNVAVVTEGVARLLWPGADPIGKRVRMSNDPRAFLTVVGLVADIHFRVHRQATPMLIRPFRQIGMTQGAFLIRTGQQPPSFSTLRDAVRSVDPNTTLVEASTMDELIAPEIAQPRLNAWLLSSFAFIALLLAAIGLYGIMASAVAQQTRELGVRMALGATPDRLKQMVLGQALKVAGIGTAVGLLGAVAGSRLLSSMLFEVTPTDPVTLVGVSVLLLVVALFAAYSPARRATRIDPAQVLRAE